MNRFLNILKKTDKELKDFLYSELEFHYEFVEDNKDYLYFKGNLPVLLVAHLDVVHKEIPQIIYKEITNSGDSFKLTTTTGIGGDDRCGVWIILKIIEKFNKLFKDKLSIPSILFTMDEEVGGLGAQKFIENYKTLDANFILEYDRKGYTDVVAYDDGNDTLTKSIEKIGSELGIDYKENFGSFTDISYLCPHFGISGVNISSGYYNPHMSNEYIDFGQLTKIHQVGVELILRLLEEFKEPIPYEECYNTKYYNDDWYYDYRYGYNYNKGYTYPKATNSTTTTKITTPTKELEFPTEHEYLMTYASEYYNGKYTYFDKYTQTDVKKKDFTCKKIIVRNFYAYDNSDLNKLKVKRSTKHLKESQRVCNCCGRIVNYGEYLNIVTTSENYIKCNDCITSTLKAKYKKLKKDVKV